MTAPIETVVSPPAAPATGATAPANATTTTAAPATADEITALKAELATLKSQSAEQQRATEYWFNKSKAAPAKPAETATPGDDEDLLDLVATKGAKGLDELLAKRGFVRKDEMDNQINAKATQIAKEAELIQRYPDLSKQNSEFFKSTALEYGALKNKGVPENLAMELAAQKVELDLVRAGTFKTPAQKTDEAKTQKEADRLARIAAQGGDRGGGRSSQDEGEDDELTPDQKKIAAAMGVTEEAYRARAKKGVAVKRN